MVAAPGASLLFRIKKGVEALTLPASTDSRKRITMPILKLDDAALDAVFRAARPIAPHRRDAFMNDVATMLAGQELGPGVVARACKEAQRRHFDPPTLDHDSKYR